MTKIQYNERSWAIDLISEINKRGVTRDSSIKRAGGEMTLKAAGKSLFPDVLLFNDEKSGYVLQGWELKMPDTSINDIEFLDNAQKKAENLGLNSFLVWNVTTAVLYRIEKHGRKQIKIWDQLADIKKREEVEKNKDRINEILFKILDDLNCFFRTGEISSTSYIGVLTGEGVVRIILDGVDSYADNLITESQSNQQFLDDVTLWWRYEKKSYGEKEDKWIILAKNNLISVVNKFLFAHILKAYQGRAYDVDKIDENITIQEALKIFEEISITCDFWNIFKNQPGEDLIAENAWLNIIQLNKLLTDLKFEEMDSNFLHDLLNHIIDKNKRKVAGQFATPKNLAKFMTYLTIRDKSKTFIDPCCGTGTIARSVFEIKREKMARENHKEILTTIWASDKFAFPLHMATLAMTEPENMGEIIQIFNHDATELKTGMDIELHDPYDGSSKIRKLPEFGYIISNLPYVQQEDLEKVNPGIKKINVFIKKQTGKDIELNARSDLYAYLPFYLWPLLETDGFLAIIISNAWLSTKWGNDFRQILKQFFQIKFIVTSGKGRWFQNAKIITNIIVLKKRANPENEILPDEKTNFVILKDSIDEIEENGKQQELSSLIHKEKDIDEDDISLSTYSNEEIEKFNKVGISWSALFARCHWLLELKDKLVQTSKFFEINRGERRGWDELFYPDNTRGIETDYIQPVLKSSRSIQTLVAKPDSSAFCCPLSKSDLSIKKHLGALKWIENFETRRNEKSKRLPDVLKRAGIHWYTMLPTTMADIVTSMNFGDRLFFAKLEKRSFVNQRLIRFTKLDEADVELLHALLNSILGLFYLEALGFGRGEGALDLSSDQLKNNLFILNPSLISGDERAKISDSFQPLLKRTILPLPDELKASDRKIFDKQVLKSFGLSDYHGKIEESLLSLYNIRIAYRS